MPRKPVPVEDKYKDYLNELIRHSLARIRKRRQKEELRHTQDRPKSKRKET